MDKLYDETVRREIQSGDDPGCADIFYLRVMLFRATAEWRVGGLTTGYVDRQPVYLIVEARESYEGEPGPERWPRRSWRSRTYTTGPDSKRIRQAAAIADAFGGRRVETSG